MQSKKLFRNPFPRSPLHLASICRWPTRPADHVCYDPSRPLLEVKFATVRTHGAPPEARVHALISCSIPKPARRALSSPQLPHRSAHRRHFGRATKFSPAKTFLPWEFSAPARSPAHSHFAAGPPLRRILVCGRKPTPPPPSQLKFRRTRTPHPGADSALSPPNPTFFAPAPPAQPRFRRPRSPPGTHLNLVGAFQPHTRGLIRSHPARPRSGRYVFRSSN